MQRVLLLCLLVLSIALMGGSTCHFRASSGSGKNRNVDRSGSAVQLAVDTRTSDSAGGAASGGVVRTALGVSVLPTSLLELASGPVLFAPGVVAGKGAAAPALVPADLDDLAFESIALVTLPMPGRGAPVPEPGAACLFVGGVTLVTWQLRRRPPGER